MTENFSHKYCQPLSRRPIACQNDIRFGKGVSFTTTSVSLPEIITKIRNSNQNTLQKTLVCFDPNSFT